MSSEWPTVSIGEIAAPQPGSMAVGPFGSRMKADLYVASGVRVIRGNNLSGGREPEGNYVCVSEKTADSLASCCLKPGDLVFPHRGNIGEVGITPDDGLRYMLSTSLMKLAPDRTRVSPLFLMYFFKSSIGRAALLVNTSQVGTPGIATPLKSLRGIQLSLPPLSIQNEIAATLSRLDDRITLLRETNATLEAIAQALFKSWFGDFDPVRAKQQGLAPEGMDEATAALFPDEFEESELGLVPSGWRAGALSDLATYLNGYAFKTKDWLETGHPVVKIGNVKPGLIDVSGASCVSPETVVGLERFKLNRSDLLVGMTGYVGETGLVPSIDPPAYLNQRVGKISTTHGVHDLGFVYCLVRNPAYKAHAELKSHGSAQANVSGTDLMAYPCVLPDSRILDAFNEILRPMLERILESHEKAQTLASLRDNLLPRLISGQMRLGEVQAQSADIAP